MPLYQYRCPVHGPVELRHPMAECGIPHECPDCHQEMRRVFVALHHWWPSNHRPGFENSGQRAFLDPDFQSRARDQLAEAKEAHVNREAKS